VAATDPAGDTSRIEYDALSRPVRAIDANGAVTTTEYDRMGRVVAVTDPSGVRTTRAYDETGTLVELRLGSKSPATRKRCYSDDWQAQGCRYPVAATGYEELLTDPNGHSTVFRFDELGRVIQHVDGTPEEGVTQMAYDLRGSLREVVDPIGATTLFDVDALGRVTSATRPYATAPELTQYDATGNPIRITRPGGCELLQDFDEMGRRSADPRDGSACLFHERPC
jgi:YD repeat-containing protein